MSEIAQAIKNNRDSVNKLTSNPIIMLCINVALLIVGIAFIAKPSVGIEVVVMIIGIALLVYGVVKIATEAIKHFVDGASLLFPVIAVVAGILLIVFRNFTANVILPLIVGIWGVYYGITKLIESTKIRKAGGYWRGQLVMALLMLCLGVVVLLAMVSGGNAIGVILGVCLIAYSAPAIVKTIMAKAGTM